MLCLLLKLSLFTVACTAFSSSSVVQPQHGASQGGDPRNNNNNNNNNNQKTSVITADTNDDVKIHSYEQAFAIIDGCAQSRQATDDLYAAVVYLEDHADEIYPDLTSNQALWQRAHGSFELVFSTGSQESTSFHKPPCFLPFSYAMLNDHFFGNGVGRHAQDIWLSLRHQSYLDVATRQLVVCVRDVYVWGHPVRLPPAAALLWRDDTLLLLFQATPDDYRRRRRRGQENPPPTFTLVGASDRCLVARGNQSGGLAIWTRLPFDISPFAYKG